MKSLRSQWHWLVALTSGFCLVVAAVSVAERPQLPPLVTATDVRELSLVFREVAKKATPCVVTIETRGKVRQVADGDEGGDPFEELFKNDPRFKDFFRRGAPRQMPRSRGMGSGFIVDSSGLIVTNNHVVADADEITVRLHDGREFKGKDVKTDPRTDVAILKIDAGEKLPALRFGDSDQTEVGDWVIAVGNPFGQELTVTSGIISAKGRGPNITEREDFLQTDAAINPGNSGGPLLNLNGDVIGINTAISSQSGGFDGIGFAVPSKMAYWVTNQLVQNGSVRRAYIGIAIQQLDAELSKQFSLKPGDGALVTEIREGSPGEQAKLQTGDVVLSLNGQKVSSPRSLQAIVERLNVDETYPLDILRDDKRMTLKITLKAMPEDYSLAKMTRKPRVQSDSATTVESLGFDIRDITADVAKQLGIAEESGVIVSTVEANGPASGKLAAGDIIQKVGNRPVHNRKEFEAALNEAKGDSVLLFVKTDSATRFVVLSKSRK